MTDDVKQSSQETISNLKSSLLGPQSLVSVKDLNDNLPTPRCPHCNHRFNTTFDSLLESNLSCDQYINKYEPELDYCDRMTLYSDEAIYKQYVRFRSGDHVHTADCNH